MSIGFGARHLPPRAGSAWRRPRERRLRRGPDVLAYGDDLVPARAARGRLPHHHGLAAVVCARDGDRAPGRHRAHLPPVAAPDARDALCAVHPRHTASAAALLHLLRTTLWRDHPDAVRLGPA